MSHSYREEVTLNPSSNTTFSEVLEARLSRRGLLKGAAAAAVAASLPLAGCAGTGGQREPVLGFTGIS
ncbi:MAG: hypothetical protein LW892_05810, partial [Betaproteobacteria bacterium]|nr:hypothetical protein [Betaproteobacteria bacterium]